MHRLAPKDTTADSSLIELLLQPDAYPHPVNKVELIETHISWVLLTGDYVYKIKKAVDFGFLDYSTLGKRRYYCQRELKLNRRLCSDTYIGVVPIRKIGDGYRIDPVGQDGPRRKGRIVEYAVLMRRLPEEGMMHRLLTTEVFSSRPRPRLTFGARGSAAASDGQSRV